MRLSSDHTDVIAQYRESYGTSSLDASGGDADLVKLLTLGTVDAVRVGLFSIFEG